MLEKSLLKTVGQQTNERSGFIYGSLPKSMVYYYAVGNRRGLPNGYNTTTRRYLIMKRSRRVLSRGGRLQKDYRF